MKSPGTISVNPATTNDTRIKNSKFEIFHESVWGMHKRMDDDVNFDVFGVGGVGTYNIYTQDSSL